MTVYKDLIKMETLAGKPTYVDVTDEVRAAVKKSGVKEGIAVVISCHTTCAVFSEEYDHDHTPAGDTFLQADLSDGLDKIFPEQHDWKTYRYPGIQHFEEVESWPDLDSWLPGGDRTLRIFGFLDAGAVWGYENSTNDPHHYTRQSVDFGDLRYSAGIGVAWISPLGPLKFSIAAPLNEKDGDDIQRFQFQIGTGF